MLQVKKGGEILAKKINETKNVSVNVDAKFTSNYKKTFNEANKILNQFSKNSQKVFNTTNQILDTFKQSLWSKPIVAVGNEATPRIRRQHN